MSVGLDTVLLISAVEANLFRTNEGFGKLDSVASLGLDLNRLTDFGINL